MAKRKKFCKMILDRHIKAEQMFFSDESKIELGSFTRDSIRLDPQKKIDSDRYNLLNRQQKKFEKSSRRNKFLWIEQINVS